MILHAFTVPALRAADKIAYRYVYWCVCNVSRRMGRLKCEWAGSELWPRYHGAVEHPHPHWFFGPDPAFEREPVMSGNESYKICVAFTDERHAKLFQRAHGFTFHRWQSNRI